jgi:diguanylate cyclase (GGDEF)-like protein/PAS domain S-box-containing protein/putative nucleotidyltransferase with HDIG domain
MRKRTKATVINAHRLQNLRRRSEEIKTLLEQADFETWRLQTIVDHSDFAILSLSPDGIITSWNHMAEHLFGYAAVEVLGTSLLSILPSATLEDEVIFPWFQAEENAEPFHWMGLRKNGSRVKVALTIVPVQDGGHILLMSTIAGDVSPRRVSPQERDYVLEQARCLVWFADVQHTDSSATLFWKQRFLNEDAALYFIPIDRNPEESLIDAWNRACLPEDQTACDPYRTDSIRAGKSYEQEFRYRRRDGSIRWIHEDVQVKTIEHGKRWHVVGVCTDITRRKEAEYQLQAANERLVRANIQLQTLATTDGLTGLHNHRTFQERLQEEVERATRYHSSLSLVLIDLDNFKNYNDVFGHPAGDQVLQRIARLLLETVRATDFVARYGGEEFAVILPGTDTDNAKEAAERFRVAIEESIWEQRAVTASFGVSILSMTTLDAAGLIEDADRALYRSKVRGRNKVTHIADSTFASELACSMNAPLTPAIRKVLRWQQDTFGTLDANDENIRDIYSGMVESWARLVDVRDEQTRGHNERVATMMEQLARSIGMNEVEIFQAKWGTLLHDIGKIGIPDSILYKRGPLTEEEWTIMRRHPSIAYEMLSDLGLKEEVLCIPYCHHEKWDGSGYPRGLRGTEIPISVQLFTVLDVYDALKSDRLYRSGWAEERVRAYLRAESGKHFSPMAVDAFFAMLMTDPPPSSQPYRF